MRKRKNSLQIYYADEHEEMVRRFKAYAIMEGKTISDKLIEIIFEYVRRKENNQKQEV